MAVRTYKEKKAEVTAKDMLEEKILSIKEKNDNNDKIKW